MIKKNFIITIDTEGDNLWSPRENGENTENSRYIERFQKLANKYGFKPVYLTNYEMANDDFFCSLIKKYLENNQCEIGMHLHAWNTPPYYKLDTKTEEKSYLIEYPVEIMEEKIKTMTTLLKNRFGIDVISHRAGRWAMNAQYFRLLEKYGYKIDCSVTPLVSWKSHLGETGKPGTDYTDANKNISYMTENILEVPMSIRKINKSYGLSIKGILKKLFFNQPTWMRPSSESLETLKRLADYIYDEKDTDYLEFMIHSSEFMPGGSPYFKTKEDVEALYKKLENLFEHLSEKYTGVTLKEYYKKGVKNK